QRRRAHPHSHVERRRIAQCGRGRRRSLLRSSPPTFQTTKGQFMTALSHTVTRIVLMSVASIAMCYQLLPPASAQAPQKSGAAHRNNPSQGLRKVGEAVAKAVLDKNIEVLLAY